MDKVLKDESTEEDAAGANYRSQTEALRNLYAAINALDPENNEIDAKIIKRVTVSQLESS